MITREFGDGGWKAGCQNAPPPLNVYSATAEHAAWHPLGRPEMHNGHPGPVMVTIPSPAGSLLGDDPTDPAAQTRKRQGCTGMIGRFGHPAGPSSVSGHGVRL